MGLLPESLSEFVERQNGSEPEWSAQIVNSTDPEPIRRMADQLVGGLDMEASEKELDDFDDDLFLILRDGEVVASSPMKTLRDTLLMVNSDLYMTGATSVQDINVPDVIMELSDTVFALRGFPKSNTEKLVLTLVSRYIEWEALTQQTGTLRASFQRLSRLDDERGTREVYERLGRVKGLTTHVYGLPDWNPSTALNVNSHGTENKEIQKNWFVIYRSDTGQDVAMLANEIRPNTWEGYWTFEADEIRALDQYVKQTF